MYIYLTFPQQILKFTFPSKDIKVLLHNIAFKSQGFKVVIVRMILEVSCCRNITHIWHNCWESWTKDDVTSPTIVSYQSMFFAHQTAFWRCICLDEILFLFW